MYSHYSDPEVIKDVVKAAVEGDMESLRFYLKDGADPDLRDVNDVPLLHKAVFYDQYAAAALLLDAGANPDLTGGPCSYTALHFAACRKNAQITELLLAHDADPCALNSDKTQFSHIAALATPLHVAASAGAADIVEKLLAAGADAGLKDSMGKTARDIALQRAETMKREFHDPAPFQRIAGLLSGAESAASEETRREKVARDLTALRSYNPRRFKPKF